MPRVNIETKHTYFSRNSIIAGSDNEEITAVDHFNALRPSIVWGAPTYPVTGTDENNRIGRKIRSESIVSEFFIQLYNSMDNENTNTIYDYFTYNNSDTQQEISSQVSPQQPAFNTNEQALDVSIRHMFVEFDPVLIQALTTEQDFFTFFWSWFNQLHIQTGLYNISSNRMKVLRESTAYTGQFNILYDKEIHLTLMTPIYHGNVTIPYKRNLNFDGIADNPPTNHVIFQLFIGPTNIYIDYGNFNLGQFIANNQPDGAPNIIVGEITSTMKLNFTDV